MTKVRPIIHMLDFVRCEMHVTVSFLTTFYFINKTLKRWCVRVSVCVYYVYAAYQEGSWKELEPFPLCRVRRRPCSGRVGDWEGAGEGACRDRPKNQEVGGGGGPAFERASSLSYC